MRWPSVLLAVAFIFPLQAGAADGAGQNTASGAKPARSPAAKPKPPVKAAAKPAGKAPAKQLAKKTPAKPAAVPAPESPQALPRDERELVPMPWQARVAIRAEMRDRTLALDEILKLLVAGKVQEAGEVAMLRLGVPVWGAHAKLPKSAQPEQYMPEAMRRMAMDGYRAASDFATVARTGDRTTSYAMLPMLTGSCANCHQSYRIR